LAVLRQRAVVPHENRAPVGGTNRRKRQVVVAIPFEMDSVHIVQLDSRHPLISYLLVDTKSGLECSRVLVIVGGSGEIGLKEGIRRHTGKRGDTADDFIQGRRG